MKLLRSGFSRSKNLLALLAATLLGGLAVVVAQGLRITSVKETQPGQIVIDYQGDTAGRFRLLRGPTLTNISLPVATNEAALNTGQFTVTIQPGSGTTDPNDPAKASFFRVEQLAGAKTNFPPAVQWLSPVDGSLLLAPATILLATSTADSDGSVKRVEFLSGTNKIGEALVPPFSFNWEMVPVGTYTLTARAIDDQGAVGNSLAVTVTVGATNNFPLTTLSSSPGNGETEVSVSRETILRFSNPLAQDAAIGNDVFFAQFGGRKILSRVELSSDKKTASLFYLEPLPANARIRVVFIGSAVSDFLGRPVDADGDGLPGGSAQVDFETLATTPVGQTAVIGRVFASELVPDPLGTTNTINKPLAGVTITVDGAEETLRTVTDALGNFKLQPCPAGKFFVHIDGRTSPHSKYPEGDYYPFVGKQWEAAAGRTDNLAGGTGEIYLPLIIKGTLQPVSATEDTVVTFPPSVVASNAALAGVSITVPANSLFSENGARGGKVGIAPVSPNRLPGPLPSGLEFPLVITVQTDGGLNFDTPAPVCFPNLPDPGTGKPLDPGEKNYLYSFNHKQGEWEAIGSMTVSADGKSICTDPGVGVLQPGWHGSGPPPRKPTGPGQCSGGGRAALASISTQGADCLETCNLACAKDYEACDPWTNKALPWASACAAGGAAICSIGSPLASALCGGFGAGVCGTVAGGLGWANCSKQFSLCQETCNFLPPCDKPPDCGSFALPQRSKAAKPASGERLILSLADDALSNLESEISQASGIAYRAAFVDNQPFNENQLQSIQLHLDNANSLADGKLQQLLMDVAYLRDDFIIPNRLPAGNAPPYPIKFAAYAHDPKGNPITIRSSTKPFGEYELFLPRESLLDFVFFYDERTSRIGAIIPFAKPENRYVLPRVTLGSTKENLVLDSDSDGLVDVAEIVLGTQCGQSDSDGDGIPDGTEINNGTNPLDGLAVATGVIASAETLGTAVDVCAINNLAITANSEVGISVFNVLAGLNPSRVAQVDTPGTALAVTCTGNLICVADGVEGLQIVDISDPPAARIVRQVGINELGGGSAQAVASAANLVFVGTTSGKVDMLELDTGVLLQQLDLGGSVEDLAVEGTTLYAYANSRLFVLPFAHGPLERRGSIAVPPASLNLGQLGRMRLFVGNQVAYVVVPSGYRTFNVSDPDAPTLIAGGDTGQLGWIQLVPNGSGNALAIRGINPRLDGTSNVSLYDVSDPSKNDVFLTTFATPGPARAAAIYNGLGYVADHQGAMHVVNYLAYDNKKRPPTGTLKTSLTDGAATSGSFVVLRAEVKDDVQVRNVEFFVDGQRIAIDGNFPFETVYRVPTNATGSKLTFSVNLFDTGGNMASVTNAPVTVLPDNQPPGITIDSPSNGQVFFVGDVVPIKVTAIDNSGIESVSFLLNGVPVPVRRLSYANWLIDLREFPTGTNSLSAVATDLAGLKTTSSPVLFVALKGAISRELSLFVGEGSIPGTEAISRELSLFIGEGIPVGTEAISREYSVFIGDGSSPAMEAISREMSVFVNEFTLPTSEAISREVSLEVRP